MKKTRKINIVKILLVISILFIIDLLIVINSVRAESLNSANIYSIGDCGNLLTYKGVIVKVSYVQYTKDNVNYPAYCLDKTKPGAETSPYDVSINSAIKDVGLWRRIINGYPYKTIKELGVENKEEAFTATKQAIYCYIHGNNPEDYGAIGTAGQRTLNAMKNIINNAQNSNETQISNTITINRIDSEWKQDSIDKSYAYKVYSVQAGSSIMNYTVDVTKEGSESIGGIKITDENNQEKSEFSPNENFKILIPINNMKDTGTLYIKVKSKVETKPVLYGTAPSSSYQDYALTVATYEDGIGNIKDEYNKNETISLIKYFLKKGNQIQLSTKKQIMKEELTEILPLINYFGQLVIFVSSATISKHDTIEKNTTPISNRFQNFSLFNSLDIPVVLYMKPVLKGITINDLELYKKYIEKYNIKDVVIGSIFTNYISEETVHFSNKNELFYTKNSDEDMIISELSKITNVYKRSSEVMYKYNVSNHIEKVKNEVAKLLEGDNSGHGL